MVHRHFAWSFNNIRLHMVREIIYGTVIPCYLYYKPNIDDTLSYTAKVLHKTIWCMRKYVKCTWFGLNLVHSPKVHKLRFKLRLVYAKRQWYRLCWEASYLYFVSYPLLDERSKPIPLSTDGNLVTASSSSCSFAWYQTFMFRSSSSLHLLVFFSPSFFPFFCWTCSQILLAESPIGMWLLMHPISLPLFATSFLCIIDHFRALARVCKKVVYKLSTQCHFSYLWK